MADPTLDDVIARALDAYALLTELGEEIEDEWSYVNDLAEAWRARFDEVVVARGGEPAGAAVFDAVATTRGDDPLSDALTAAIDRAIDEVARIEDPHRAIDWLSTFPQVVLIALGERR